MRLVARIGLEAEAKIAADRRQSEVVGCESGLFAPLGTSRVENGQDHRPAEPLPLEYWVGPDPVDPSGKGKARLVLERGRRNNLGVHFGDKGQRHGRIFEKLFLYAFVRPLLLEGKRQKSFQRRRVLGCRRSNVRVRLWKAVEAPSAHLKLW